MIIDPNQYTDDNILNTLIAEAQALSQQLSTIKTTMDKRIVEDYKNRIARERTNLKRADESLRREIDRLKAKRKLIEITDDVLSSDSKEATGYFWALHEEEKDSKKPSGSSNID